MKLAVIVTEYPKSTETFIYRDLMKFVELGVELRLYHLTRFREDQPIHAFAAPTRGFAHHPGIASRASIRAFGRAAIRHPLRMAALLVRIATGYARTPKIAVKSLALVPQALAIAEDARRWGASHVHAEFAGHPATAAWIGRMFGGLPYSVSCRAHDIFRTQALLDRKLGAASAVRTVSLFGEAFLRTRVAGLATRAIHVIHSSIDVTRIAPVETPPSRAPFRILYVGALEPKKGVEYLLIALAEVGAQLGDWRLDAIGHGPSAAALKRQAEALGLAARISFHGVQPFETVAAAYARASVCVAPSVIGPSGRQEGIPNVMIEALAYQRPAIATAISGIPELIRDGETGLLVPQADAGALAAALLRVHADPDAALAMARRGRAHVMAEFDLAVNARRQIALFGDQ
ncbi:MAG TPA: glycosyltransferase family 4 protein [Sphingomonas sp.]|jgi:glycosyltransferase involved in cell wall biosynthesis|uniref:glycosyltransferase family 4 protein n=1 Tax=Sphingomonas sp. TaxID=28214 RepID=UPI002EDB2048